ncbi:CRISPR-associated endonuclease Cas3'' [Halapricum desulfuricans]|uniref:CRISPR-associated helicase Cas3 n=1 Tax=Halapricum desulfuricans TaxID=2841257 RepID=A0A897N6K3_9EURY|nr:CRISPR-associated endonuclease Cas3'' [Halapricum desulfuricans]QSG06006.1 CRISPR-associated helicase Cas3 [Halapricum desulfuricans]
MVYRTRDELLARPNQTLDDHLTGVRTNAKDLTPDDIAVADGWTLESVITTISEVHDIGKLTQWFQEYIHKGDSCSRSSLYRRHSLTSAYLTFHALDSMGVPGDIKLAGFYAVAKHHGVLPDFDTNHNRYSSTTGVDADRPRRVSEQLQNIDDHVPAIADEILQRATDGSLGWDDVFVDQPMVYPKALPSSFSPQNSAEFYPLVLRLWSTLVCADKTNAAGLEIQSGPPQLPDRNQIEFDTDADGVLATLNDKRTTARRDATRQLETLRDDESVFTLTLPTGFGKTFAGLEAALAEAERTNGRVIYALPFTTVIDQVHDEITERLDVTPDRERYTLHHYLADTRTRVGDGEERIADGSEVLYGKTWQAGLVLTTFVQLFESLAGPQNTQSIKLPALQDSVIVVDEPQALSSEWWYLVSRLATILVEEYDATLILMTATQPGIISKTHPELDPTELIPDATSYFDFLAEHERVRFELDDSVVSHLTANDESGISVHEAATHVTTELRRETIGSVLVVSNTVRAARQLYHELVEIAGRNGTRVVSLGRVLGEFRTATDHDLLTAVDEGDERLDDTVSAYLSAVAEHVEGQQETLVGTLSTALRPVDRSILIEAIRRILDDDAETPIDDRALVISSTQLVEAGVDVSFDRLYRDYAPIPSVVQAAGRCNRSFGGQTATVTLWRLQGIDDNPPPSSIYRIDGNLLRPTTYALESLVETHGRDIPEREMVSTGVERYYERLHSDDNRSVETDSLARAVDEADGDRLREASLIEDDAEDVLVITDDADAALLKQYIRARTRNSYARASRLFDRLNYLMASVRAAPENDLQAFVVQETDIDPVELPELVVVDARESDSYDLADGSGIRKLGQEQPTGPGCS